MLLHLSRRKQVAPVENDGGFEQGLHAIEIRAPELVPLRDDRQPVGALQGVAPDHVVHAGSLSKSLAPGLRLGWLVVPDALRGELLAARAHGDRFTTSIVQATAAEFIRHGDLDRHLRRTRRTYHQRRDALIAALHQYLPACHVTGISAGLHAVVRLPDATDATRVADTAARHGILVRPLRSSAAPALILGYSALPPHRIQQGIRHLAATILGKEPCLSG